MTQDEPTVAEQLNAQQPPVDLSPFPIKTLTFEEPGWWNVDPELLMTNELTPEHAAALGLEIRVQVRRKP